jgi:hypothetical protein
MEVIPVPEGLMSVIRRSNPSRAVPTAGSAGLPLIGFGVEEADRKIQVLDGLDLGFEDQLAWRNDDGIYIELLGAVI